MSRTIINDNNTSIVTPPPEYSLKYDEKAEGLRDKTYIELNKDSIYFATVDEFINGGPGFYILLYPILLGVFEKSHHIRATHNHYIVLQTRIYSG